MDDSARSAFASSITSLPIVLSGQFTIRKKYGINHIRAPSTTMIQPQTEKKPETSLMMNAAKLQACNDEQTEIMAVVEAETAAFLDRDIDALSDCWVQAPYIQHTTILPYCGVVQVNGIEALRKHFLAHFNNDESPAIGPGSIARKDWKFVVREGMAWVTFEQFASTSSATHMSGSQMHTRVLEKVSDTWRIISSTGVLSRVDFFDCPRIQVDGSAKILETGELSVEVLETHPVLKVCGDRLGTRNKGDAGKLKSLIQQAQKNIDSGIASLPVPIIFEGESSSDSSLCWIAILDMKIIVLLDDVRLIEANIKVAGEIYGLSATQMRVAEEIAKGKELTSIAKSLEISTNTVRTHVRRMFDRVGVNSQKELLKKLLSANPPSIGLHY
jgi:DNA-binding CsgD family transcriptional regulator